MQRIPVLVLALLAAAPASADLGEAVRNCAAIQTDAARLQCFDTIAAGLARRPASAPAAPATPATPATPASVATPARDVTARPAAASSRTSTESSPAEQAFGFARQRERQEAREIRSRYDGQFTGWRGKTYFRLENGQVWRQIDNSKMVYRANRPMIIIKKGLTGAYYLRVQERNTRVKVRRVK